MKLAAGSARITSRITHARFDFNFAVLHGGGHNLLAGIGPQHDNFPSFVELMRHLIPRSEFSDCSHKFDQYFGNETYSLKSLFCDERRRIVGQLVDSTLADIDQLYADVCEHHTALIGFLRELGMPLPPILRVSCEFSLTNAMRRCASENSDLGRARILLNAATQNGISIDGSIKTVLRERLNSLMERWANNPWQVDVLAQLDALASLMREPVFQADLWQTQNIFFERMIAISCLAADVSTKWLDHFGRVAASLGIALAEPFPAAGISAKSVRIPGALPPTIESESADLCADIV
jgi:hypothetical protein